MYIHQERCLREGERRERTSSISEITCLEIRPFHASSPLFSPLFSPPTLPLPTPPIYVRHLRRLVQPIMNEGSTQTLGNDLARIAPKVVLPSEVQGSDWEARTREMLAELSGSTADDAGVVLSYVARPAPESTMVEQTESDDLPLPTPSPPPPPSPTPNNPPSTSSHPTSVPASSRTCPTP